MTRKIPFLRAFLKKNAVNKVKKAGFELFPAVLALI